jgi:hypothetical protein
LCHSPLASMRGCCHPADMRCISCARTRPSMAAWCKITIYLPCAASRGDMTPCSTRHLLHRGHVGATCRFVRVILCNAAVNVSEKKGNASLVKARGATLIGCVWRRSWSRNGMRNCSCVKSGAVLQERRNASSVSFSKIIGLKAVVNLNHYIFLGP